MNKTTASEHTFSFIRKFKYYIFGLGLLVISILVIQFKAFYLKRVSIYEPVTISIPGLTDLELKTIEVYATTPLNRIVNIPFNSMDTMVWQSNYGFIKSIELSIPDSLFKKINDVKVFIKETEFTVPSISLQRMVKSYGKTNYLLPDYVRSKASLVNMTVSVFYWHDTILLLKILLIITIFLFFFNKKLRSKIYPVFSFLNSNKKISQTVHWVIKGNSFVKWIKIMLISIFIACSLFFGYLFLKYTLVTFVTSMLFIIWFGLIFLLIIWIFTDIFKISKTYTKRIFTIFIIFLFFWICLESFLRIMGIGRSYNEKIGLFYSSGFIEHDVNNNQNQGLMVHPKKYCYIDKRTEYAYKVNCNTDGLRDIDHTFNKDSGECRIICLGNSFTEGVGAPQDSTWPKLLEDRLKLHTNRKITVFNAGISGSDPFFEYMLLERKMLEYNPDLVLVALGSSDFDFYRFRGGFERFTKNGCHYRKAPYWEGFYALSYIFRFFINNILMYQNFLSPAEFKADNTKAIKNIEDCIGQFKELSVKKHFNLAFMFIDDRETNYFPVIKKMKEENTVTVFDMFEYNNKIEKIIPVNQNKYYWSIDGHCNPKGYALIAKGVEWNLIKFGIIDSLKLKNKN